jgi:hypothetical protein
VENGSNEMKKILGFSVFLAALAASVSFGAEQ